MSQPCAHRMHLGDGSILTGTVTTEESAPALLDRRCIARQAVARLAPEWRLFVITGFCGGLTTFSTFSAEIVTLLQQGRGPWACGAVALHLAGSVLMTFAGIGTFVWARSFSAAADIVQSQ